MADGQPFGPRVRERRRSLDLTQEELARRVGCASVTLRKIEGGHLRASRQIAERLAVALGIPLEERETFVRAARSAPVERGETREPTPSRTPLLTLEESGSDDLSGRAIRSYQLGERIGAGGFGAVYRAVQPGIEREVAIKLILPRFADHPDFIRRFEGEARLVARLEHPHIVPLYDYWRDPGFAFLVMRYLRGGSLNTQLVTGPLAPERVLQLAEQIGAALQTAHRSGVVHRDLKPSNILLDEEGNAFLADFGIAKDLALLAPEQTVAGAIVGSPAYSSPEQLRAEPVTPQADIYAFGVLLYELLTGQRPFRGPTPAALIQQQLTSSLPRLAEARPGLGDTLDQILQRATAKLPGARYPDVPALLAELREALADHPAPAIIRRNGGPYIAPPTLVLDLEDGDNPYKGLQAFDEADGANYFGRETLVHQLLSRMGEGAELSRFLALIGPSGSGKSSLARAGLLPALRRGGLPGSESWYMMTLTPGARPLDELAGQLRSVAPFGVEADDLRALLGADEQGLLRAARLVLPSEPQTELLLLIDQFEELFTLCEDREERAHVLRSLVTAVLDERSRLRVVVTLRADFIDQALLDVDFGELLRQRGELVLPMTAEELERAIVGPAHRLGLSLEDGLVATMIAEVGAQPGALPLLQYTLSELYRHRSGRVLTRSAYAELGGVSGALAASAESIYQQFSPAEQIVARQLLLRLVTPGLGMADTRRRAGRAELAEVVRLETLEAVSGALGRGRLLTFDHDPTSREATVEVAHETLLHAWPRLRDWIAESREALLAERRLALAAAEWERSGREASFLASGARLEQYQALSTAGAIALTAEEQAYLEAGLAEQTARDVAEQARQAGAVAQARALADEQRQRAEAAHSAERAQHAAAGRLRILVGALTVFLLVTAGLSLFAFTQQQAAQRNLTRSEARRLAGEAQRLALADGESTVIGLLAARALGTEYTPEGDAALASAAALDYPVQQFNGGGQTLVNAVAFSPDGASVLVGSQDGTAHLWDRRTGQEQRVFTHPGGDLWGVAFSPDGATVLAGVAGGVQLWDARTGAQLRFLKVNGGVGSVAFSPDGRRLLIGSTDVLILDLASGRELRRLTGHPVGIWRAVFSPDGRFVLSSGGDARLWDAESGRLLHVLFGNSGDVQGVAFSPDGATVATGEGGTIRIWDAASGRELRQLVGHKPVVRSLAFTPDGKRLVSASDDATVRVWDVATGVELRRLVGHTSTVFWVDVSPDGQYAVSGSLDATALVWDLDASPVSPRMMAKDSVTGVIYTPDGKQVITTSIDGTATVSDAATGSLIRSFTAPAKISVAALAPGGAYLLAGCADATIYALDLTTGQELRRFVGQPTAVAALAVSPDGKYLVSGGVSDPDHYLWDARTGALLRRFQGHTYANAFAAAFSPDSRLVVTGSYDYTVRVWEVATGREVRRISFPTDGVAHGASSVAYAPDGKRILTGSWDGVIRLWDAESGTLVRSYIGHSGAVFTSAFSPDGRQILTGSTDRTARLWDTETGVEVRRLAGNRGDVTRVAFAPQGGTMATGSADGSTRLWDIDVQATVAALCGRLIRDFTPAERAQYGIADTAPTCSIRP